MPSLRIAAVTVAVARAVSVVGVGVGVRVTSVQAQVVQPVLQTARVAGLPRFAQVARLVGAGGGPARGSAAVLVAAHFLSGRSRPQLTLS